MAESPAGIREHIESQGDRFKQEAIKLFSLEEGEGAGHLTVHQLPPSQETRPVGRPLLFSRVRRPLPGRVSPEISLLLKQNRKIRFKTFI